VPAVPPAPAISTCCQAWAACSLGGLAAPGPVCFYLHILGTPKHTCISATFLPRQLRLLRHRWLRYHLHHCTCHRHQAHACRSAISAGICCLLPALQEHSLTAGCLRRASLLLLRAATQSCVLRGNCGTLPAPLRAQAAALSLCSLPSSSCALLSLLCLLFLTVSVSGLLHFCQTCLLRWVGSSFTLTTMPLYVLCCIYLCGPVHLIGFCCGFLFLLLLFLCHHLLLEHCLLCLPRVHHCHTLLLTAPRYSLPFLCTYTCRLLCVPSSFSSTRFYHCTTSVSCSTCISCCCAYSGRFSAAASFLFLCISHLTTSSGTSCLPFFSPYANISAAVTFYACLDGWVGPAACHHVHLPQVNF